MIINGGSGFIWYSHLCELTVANTVIAKKVVKLQCVYATSCRAGSIRNKTDTIRIAIRTKQYAIRIDDTIQR